MLVILFRIVCALEFFLVLRVERLIHAILESEFLITANDYRDERVDEACHATYYRKSLVKGLDGVLATQHFSVLDHVKGEPTVVRAALLILIDSTRDIVRLVDLVALFVISEG